jgi:hypothetical protein
VGCHIGSLFVGALAYADDLVLIAPSANAMRSMLNVCDEFAAQFNVVFNATKSKCIYCISVGASRYVNNFATRPSFYIGSQVIEYVDRWPHLGHIITNDCDDAEDIRSRKLSFIGQANKILFNFRNVDSVTKIKLIKLIALVFMVLSYGTYRTVPLTRYALRGARVLGRSGTFLVILIRFYYLIYVKPCH